MSFEPVSGRARLRSWTVTYHKVVAGLESYVPYLCLLIELAEQDGLFMLSDRIDSKTDTTAFVLGAPMRVEFQPIAGDVTLPQFGFVGGEAIR